MTGLSCLRLCAAVTLACCLQGCQPQAMTELAAPASAAAAGAAIATLSAADKALARFKREILKSEHIPPDLLRLHQTETRRAPKQDEYADPYEMLGLRLIQPGALPALMTGGYLSAEERQRPDIRANIKAIDEVFAHCTFVATDDNGNLIGYWRSPKNLPLAQAPIVRFDTEGQFELLDGLHITEAVTADWTFGDAGQFTALKTWFGNIGVPFSGDKPGALASPAGAPQESPADMHGRLYKKHLADQTAN